MKHIVGPSGRLSPISVALFLIALASCAAPYQSVEHGGGPPPPMFDVVVYGGTAGGVITAVAAAREGLNVALVEPGLHLGGMVAGGLGWTDYGRKEMIGGYSLEFFERVGAKYGRPIEWHFEPNVAEVVFNDLVKESGVHVMVQNRLRESSGVVKTGTRVDGIALENGAVVRGRIFVDASYEGDLMAQAGVSYTWGREGTGEYHESLAAHGTARRCTSFERWFH
jgi:NADPH-dependent 2,4-dienoyl-CoA reductase/sulfur reductase-like enzyme